MTTPDLFDTPTTTPGCPRCRAEVLRVLDTELDIHVDLDPTPIPALGPFPADRTVFELHPTAGWHNPSSPRRRGYPIHLIHTCATTTTKASKP
ncbi:hypothetical protein [Micromonospora maritima]|uniref:hypothetical protein n=1 Tax=Micromonospora maritima TaxID=986711 RepID=UPI00157BF7BF|nr:hypothetical protein [Micromonospora maritima]